MERQGFGIRLAAALIDLVAILLMALLVNLIFGQGFRIYPPAGTGAGRTAAVIVSDLVFLAYFITEILNAASPGKLLLGLRIASETGSPAPQNQLITRYAIKLSPTMLGLIGSIIPFIGFLFGILGIIAALAIVVGFFFTLGPKRQALHDMLAQTAVYRLGPAAPVGPGVVATPPAPPVV